MELLQVAVAGIGEFENSQLQASVVEQLVVVVQTAVQTEESVPGMEDHTETAG